MRYLVFFEFLIYLLRLEIIKGVYRVWGRVNKIILSFLKGRNIKYIKVEFDLVRFMFLR